MELVYGVMVTQLFLVQSFKVRVLVDQQKTPQVIEEFFLCLNLRVLDLKSNNGSNGMVYQILADAAIEKMGKSCSSVGAHAN